MGARAVFTIEDTNGNKTSPPRLFHAPWASPEFQIPHLADFYTWTVEHQQPLNLATYLGYAAEHPETLPAHEVTGSEFGNENYRGDLDYRYRLTLAEDEHGLQLVVRAMHNAYMQPKPIVIETLNQASLYDAAARMCDLVAARAQQYANRNDGVPMPGADPQQWTERAHSYRQQQQQQQFPITAAGANLTAQFLPATFDGSYPAIKVAGVLVFAYIHPGGHLQISVHLDEAEPWLIRSDSAVGMGAAGNPVVPMRITVEDTDVFTR